MELSVVETTSASRATISDAIELSTSTQRAVFMFTAPPWFGLLAGCDAEPLGNSAMIFGGRWCRSGGMSEMAWQEERLEHNRLARAQRGDEDAFAQLTEPYRRELQLHC